MKLARQDIDGLGEVDPRLAIESAAGLQEVEMAMEEMIPAAQALLSRFAAGNSARRWRTWR